MAAAAATIGRYAARMRRASLLALLCAAACLAGCPGGLYNCGGWPDCPSYCAGAAAACCSALALRTAAGACAQAGKSLSLCWLYPGDGLMLNMSAAGAAPCRCDYVHYGELPDTDARGRDLRPPPPPPAAGGRRAAPPPAPAAAFTKVCGGGAAVRAACEASYRSGASCGGFVLEPDGKCGYLKSEDLAHTFKSKNGVIVRKGWRTFVRAAIKIPYKG